MRRFLLLAWFLLTSVALFTPAAEVGQVNRSLRSVPLLGALLKSPLCRAMLNDSAAWHAALFCVLALLVLYQWDPARKPQVLAGLLAVTGFSVLSEALQAGFVPGRALELKDLLVNQTAILLGTGLALAAQARVLVTKHTRGHGSPRRVMAPVPCTRLSDRG